MPCLILSLLVVGRARLDEYRAVRNAVEEVLDVSRSTPCPSNRTHPFIFKREHSTDLSQKNIYKNRQSNDRATRLPSVWSWWPAWSIPTISHTSAVARSAIRFWYLCITNKELWPDRKCLIRWLWNPAWLKASWGRLWTGAIFLRQLCENLQGELLTFKSF